MLLALLSMMAAALSMNARADEARDREAIAALHALDERASREGDYRTLASLLAEDVVVMMPGQPPIRGRAAAEEQMKQLQSQMRDVKVTAYRFHFDEVQIVGDYAIEWGSIEGTSSLPGGETRTQKFNVMRVLARHGESWKIHRSIFNAQDAPRSPRSAIEQTLTEWRAAFAKSDVDALVGLVAADAEFWTYEQAPVKGRAALAEVFKQFFSAFECDQEFQPSEITVRGDLAFVRGLEIAHLMRRADKARFDVEQRAFSVLRLESDGRWRFARGMTNRGPAAK